MKTIRTKNWDHWTAFRLKHIVRSVQGLPQLRREPILWQVDFHWMSPKMMQRYNYLYLGKNRPTDVLSFPTIAVFRKQGVLGTLLICLPVLWKQAQAMGHSLEVELEIILIHGVLHLLGFDHETTQMAAKQMAWFESLLLKKQGVIRLGLIARQ